MAYDLRLLRYAVALADHRNFARAAKSVHVSQPTLSRGIKNLEDECGCCLFERTSMGAEPTDAGLVLLKHAREVLALSQDLGREMNLLAGLELGALRIGSGTYPTNMFVDRAVCRFIREHPGAQIAVANDNWSNLVPSLRKREIDLAVIDVSTTQDDPDMKVIKLRPHKGCLAVRAGHPLLKKAAKSQSLRTWDYPFVSTSRMPLEIFRRLAESLGGPGNGEPAAARTLVPISCESLHMMKTIATETDAIAILPLKMIADELKSGKLGVIPAPDWLQSNFGIARLAHRSLSPLGEEFVRMVDEADAELLAWEERTAASLLGRK